MKASIGIVNAVIVVAMALASVQAQADVIKHFVRLGAFGLNLSPVFVPLTTSGDTHVYFNGSGRFTIWYTAECAASGYVDVYIVVDDIALSPTGSSDNDSFCDPETRGAMHTVTGRTVSLASGTHKVDIVASKAAGVAYLSDSSLLIGK